MFLILSKVLIECRGQINNSVFPVQTAIYGFGNDAAVRTHKNNVKINVYTSTRQMECPIDFLAYVQVSTLVTFLRSESFFKICSDHECSQTIFREYVFLCCCSVGPFIRAEAIFYSSEMRLNLLVCATSPVCSGIGIRVFCQAISALMCAIPEVLLFIHRTWSGQRVRFFLVGNLIWHHFCLFESTPSHPEHERSHKTRSTMSNMQSECSCRLRCPNVQMPSQTEIIATTKEYIGNCEPRRWFGWKWVFCFPYFNSPFAILYILHILCVWFYVLSKWVVCCATQHNNKREIFY